MNRFHTLIQSNFPSVALSAPLYFHCCTEIKANSRKAEKNQRKMMKIESGPNASICWVWAHYICEKFDYIWTSRNCDAVPFTSFYSGAHCLWFCERNNFILYRSSFLLWRIVVHVLHTEFIRKAKIPNCIFYFDFYSTGPVLRGYWKTKIFIIPDFEFQSGVFVLLMNAILHNIEFISESARVEIFFLLNALIWWYQLPFFSRASAPYYIVGGKWRKTCIW